MKPAKVPVLEVMSRDPVVATPDLPIDEAARIMRDRNVGSLIVVDRGAPLGIITERDIVTKVTAEDRAPSSVLVRDAMSAPVLSVHPHEDLEEAAKRMRKHRVRRLAVVQDGVLVGVVTENDVLRMWPDLIDVTREWARAGMLASDTVVKEGTCELCGIFSADLAREENLLVCPDCRAR